MFPFLLSFSRQHVVKMKHCCKNVVILMPEPVAEPALNGLRLNLRIVSIVINFASYLTIGLPRRITGLCP